jgi:hypothetical protein
MKSLPIATMRFVIVYRFKTASPYSNANGLT